MRGCSRFPESYLRTHCRVSGSTIKPGLQLHRGIAAKDIEHSEWSPHLFSSGGHGIPSENNNQIQMQMQSQSEVSKVPS